MSNLLEQFRALLPRTPLLVGTVQAVSGAECRIETDDGSLYVARGSAQVEDRVYFRPGGSIEGSAPDLTSVDIEI